MKIEVQQLIALAELGQAASEYIAAINDRKNARIAYQDARDVYMRELDPARTLRVFDILGDSAFQDATDHLYQVYQAARQDERNAYLRMETKYRRVGGVK